MERRQRRRVDVGPEDEALRAEESDDRVRQEVEALFNFAVNHFRKATPPRGSLSDRCTLYDFQQEALGWMLHREQYTTTKLVPETRTWSRLQSGSMVNTAKKIEIVVPLDRSGAVCGARPGPALDRDSVKGGMNLTVMGLGKTLQMISLIVTHMPRGTLGTLVIMQPILLDQWEEELRRCAPRLRVYQLYGRNRQNTKDHLRLFDVVLTSYDTFAIEMESPRFAALSWWRVILDEAHEIRNAENKTAEACHRVLGEHRFVMTGTPIQNTWGDLFSLLKFLRVRPYGEYAPWIQLIERPLRTGTETEKENALGRLRSIIRRLAIRHTKTQENPDATIREGATLETRDAGALLELAGVQPLARRRTPPIWVVDEVETERFHIVPRETTRTPRLAIPFGGDYSRALTLRREYVYLPPTTITYQNLGFNFTPRNNEFYKCVYDRVRGSGKESFVLINDLRRFCVNPRLVDIGPPDACDRLWSPKPRDPSWSEEYIAKVKAGTLKFETSVKLDALVRDLDLATQRDALAKSVVFSEWTTALDLVEFRLQEAGWYSELTYASLVEQGRSPSAVAPRYVRIDGQMNASRRAWSLRQISNNEGVKLILLSLKAAGVGLNLVRASNVFFMEPSFNPGLTSQAIDRVGRIGQPRPIFVTIYVTDDTVEEKIVNLANYKRRIADQTLETAPVSREVVTRIV